MHESLQPLRQAIHGNVYGRKPMWFMRQAGRYLPEYKKVREGFSDFIEFCLTPEAASEVTLQPLRRFDLDAAIVFADILLIPYAMGHEVRFVEGQGPVLAPISSQQDLGQKTWSFDRLRPVMETLSKVKAQIRKDQSLIGFAGSPWTVACYMVEGGSSPDFPKARDLACSSDLLMDFLIEDLVNATKDYLLAQIEAGADVVQLFESHAGLLEGDDFDRLVIEPTQRLVRFVKDKYPDCPVIGFARGAGYQELARYANQTGIDVLSVDSSVSLKDARSFFPKGTLQGNLSPVLLKEGGDKMEAAIQAILSDMKGQKHIFNLGHGILPETPIAHVEKLVALVRAEG